MDIHIIRRYYVSMLLFVFLVEAQNSSTDQLLPEIRKGRATGRIETVYSGYKPDTIYCTHEGFQADPKNCKVFYRCTKSGKGKFTVFKFECAPGTIYDPEIEVCNYPKSTKRVECGGFDDQYRDSNDMNEVGESEQGFPSPTTIKVPTYTERTTRQHTTYSNHNKSTKNPITTIMEKQELNKFISSTVKSLTTTATYEDSNIKTSSSLSTLRPLLLTTNGQTTPILNLKPNFESSGGKPNLQNNKCTSDGFMGDYENCYKFYRCVGNQLGGFIRYEFSCSEPTIWDDDIKSCNHPWAVKKSKCGKSRANAGFTKVLDDISQTTPSEYVPPVDEYDIHKTIQKQTQIGYGSGVTQTQISQQSGVQNQTQISYGSAVSQSQTQINYGHKVLQTQLQIDHSNKSSQTQTQITESITEINKYFNKNEEQHTTHNIIRNNNICTQSGFMGDSSNCKKFYRCVDNGKGGYTRYEFSCGQGTLWDQKLEVCNHAWAVQNCVNKYFPQEIYTSASTMQSTPSYITSTKLTEAYNLTKGETNDKNNGNNNNQNKDPTTTSLLTVATTIANSFQSDENECRSDGFMGDKVNCKIFYRCVKSSRGYMKYKFECGEGTSWDPHIEACNYASEVYNCSTHDTPIKEESMHYNSTQIHGENGTNYILNYHNTSSTPIHKTTQATSTMRVEIDNKCSKTGFVGDSKDCKKFYRCVDNGDGSFTRYEFSCGDEAVWDETIEACNHKWSVEKCGLSNATFDNSNGDVNEQSTLVILLEKEENNMVQNNSDYDKTTVRSTTSFPTAWNVNCTENGFYGDKVNCRKFYRCVNNGHGGFDRYEFECGQGTVWDKTIEACNHKSLVKDCSTEDDSSIANNESITPSITLTDSHPSTEGLNRSNTSVTSEKTYLSYTTENQQNVEENYSSTNITQKEEHKIHNNQLNTDNFQCSSEGFHADLKDCSKFFRCVGNNEEGFTKYNFSCPQETIWKQEIQSCDYDYGVSNCSVQNELILNQLDTSQQSSTSTSVSSITDSAQLGPPEDDATNKKVSTDTECKSEGFHSDKNNCKRFYRCVDDGNGGLKKYDFTCGEGTAWDDDIETCNYIHLVNSCQSSSSPSESTTSKENYLTSTTIITNTQESSPTDLNEISTEKNSCSKEGLFGDVNDCKKFYRCVDDGKNGYMKYNFTCGDGTIWDQDIGTCNHPKDVKNPTCERDKEDNSATDALLSSSTSISTSTTQSSSSIIGNSETSSTTRKQETSNQPENNNFTCTEAGFFANPNNCKKFYRCVDWNGDGSTFSIFYFECGEGTIWDPALQTCNYEESVLPPRNCSSTQSQTESNQHETSTTKGTTEKLQTTSQISTQGTSNSQTTDQTNANTQSTTQTTTTKQLVTSEKITTQLVTSTENTTTEETTTTEQSTNEQTTSSQGLSTTTIQTTVRSTTNNEQSTTQQATTIEKESTTSEQITTTQLFTESITGDTTIMQASTTEQNIQQSTDNQITTDQTVTEQANTTESSSTNGTSTTTQSSTEALTTEGIKETTTEETLIAEKKCPETDQDQYLFVCPTSFRRHPKYCNLFYQCTEDDDTHDAKIAVFTCPNNTIYDESKVQCVEENKAEKDCEGQIASRRRVKRLGIHYKEPIVTTSDIHICTLAGDIPFEKNSECSPAFMKCEKSKSGKLRGFVYQCPQNYIYWSISKKCERKEYVRDCKRTANNWYGRWEIPIEKKNVAW